MSLKIYITVLKRKTSLDVILKHKTPSSFSGLITARAEINSTRALPVIARAWLRHCREGGRQNDRENEREEEGNGYKPSGASKPPETMMHPLCFRSPYFRKIF